jgi:hypothetical protein
MNDLRMNGHDDLETAISEMAQISARAGTAVSELPPPSALPLDQKTHDLLLKSVDQITADWVDQLMAVRKHSQQIEQRVLERAGKVKADLTVLFLLGGAARAEAKRGDEVNAKLADELDKLVG